MVVALRNWQSPSMSQCKSQINHNKFPLTTILTLIIER